MLIRLFNKVHHLENSLIQFPYVYYDLIML